ncbi:Virulence sensor protein bvgS precursor [hydrothermal vent metagenome]|uniref:histidine kinase n=1 Tax=hydrothermal vent metagenome TaxID=652676 RepID=A0A3B0W9E3_9ZZZZ
MNLLPSLAFKPTLFFLLCLFSLQAHALTLTLEERAWIEQNPTITLGSDYAWAPYDFVDSQNQHAGISADIIEIIRQKTGLDIQIKSGVWADIMTDMQSGRLDGLVCAVQTPERLEYLNFSSPYTSIPLAIVTRINQSNIQSVDDLKGRKVGVNKGSYLHEWLKTNYPDIVLVLTHSNEQALDFVSFGQVDAYFGNVAVATYVIRQKYLTNLKIVAKVNGLETKTSIAIDKNQPILMSIMQKSLADIKPEVTRAINEKWLFQSQQEASQRVVLTPQEQQWMKSFGAVNVASELDWPPFDFIDDSKAPVGLSLDYLTLIAQKTGLKLNVTADSWPKNLSDLEYKKADLLPAAVKNKDRERYAIFSDPYFKAKDYFFIRDDLHVENLSDLDGKTVALPKEYASIPVIQRDYPNILILETSSVQASIEAVLQNKAQLLYGLYPSISYKLRETGLNNILPFKATQGNQNLNFMVRKDIPELVSILNKGLASITGAEKQALESKWLIQSQQDASQGVVLTPQEQQWMNSFGAVNVASELDWPPFNFIDDAKAPVGLSLDYLMLIAQKTGLKLNVTADSWPKNLSDLEYKRADLLPAAVKNKNRERYATFSDPYFKAKNYFFIRDDLDVEDLSDLDGKTVALPKGFSSIRLIQQNYPNILILETTSVQASIEAVLQNKAQLLYGVYPTISYLLRKTGVNTIMPFKATQQADQNINFMVRKDAPELVSILNKGLAAITSAEKQFIESKWLVPVLGGAEPMKTFSLSEKEQLFLQQNSTFRFTGDPDWLPFEAFTQAGEYKGIVSDFLKEIEKKLPLSFESVPVSSWQDTLDLADQKKVDVISGDVDDAHLAQNYKPIEPYIITPIVIVMNEEAGFVNAFSELQDKSIAIVKGYGYTHTLLRQFSEHQFREYDTSLDVLNSIASGHSDAAVLSLPVASYLIKKHGFYHLKIAGKTDLEMSLTLFVLKDKPILHQLLNRVMKEVSEERGGEILNAWIKLNFASKADYWLIFQIVLISLLFISIIVYWNLKLSKEIKQRKAIEQQLETEKDKFKHLFEKATDGHLIYQRNYFVACNQAALTLLGLRDKKELLEQDIIQFSPEYQPDGELSINKRKRLTQNCFNQGMQRFDWLLKSSDGQTFWVDVVYTSIPYLGKPAIYVSWRDKTEQKALEESLKQNEAQIKLLIDSIPLIVIVTDFEGGILNANRKAIDDYQVVPEQISTLNIANFYQHSSDRDEIKRRLQSDGRVDQKVVTMKDFKGRAREMMLSVIPIKYHNQSALLTIAVDLTERILAEKQLKEAMAKAEAANRSKTEFLANMSHEIRTPMNAILGFTELLNEQVQEPRLKSFISTIQSAGNTLLMLINDILDLSKIEAGKMSLNKVATNPHDLFQEVGDIFTMNIQKKGLDFYIEIDPEIPKTVLLDPVRLRQVLFNLLGNAVKFTETGFIKLSVKSLSVFDHLSKMNLLIKVEDTGMGIPLDQQDRIFNVFEQQSGQDSGKFGGTGLGLSITKRLVKMMQGTMSLESTPGQGSTFSVLLEKIDVASIDSQPSFMTDSLDFNPKAIEFKKATILVVDDILDNRELICQNFVGIGLEVIQAENGQEAIDLYKKHEIDFILMDIRMPVLNGYEAAKVIKSLNPKIPIVALTASVMQDEFEKIRREYFDDYLRKPVLRNDLIKTLAQFLTYRDKGEEELKQAETRSLELDETQFSETLRQALHDEVSELYQEAVNSNSIDDIKTFAKKIAGIASTHESESLDYFASQLLERVDSFDIAGMQFLLKKYEEVAKGVN